MEGRRALFLIFRSVRFGTERRRRPPRRCGLVSFGFSFSVNFGLAYKQIRRKRGRTLFLDCSTDRFQSVGWRASSPGLVYFGFVFLFFLGWCWRQARRVGAGVVRFSRISGSVDFGA